MVNTTLVTERLKAIDEHLAKLRARRDRIAARATQAERQRDTRQKVVLGGTVHAAVEHEGMPPLTSREELLAWLEKKLDRPQDRAVFELARRP